MRHTTFILFFTALFFYPLISQSADECQGKKIEIDKKGPTLNVDIQTFRDGPIMNTTRDYDANFRISNSDPNNLKWTEFTNRELDKNLDVEKYGYCSIGFTWRDATKPFTIFEKCWNQAATSALKDTTLRIEKGQAVRLISFAADTNQCDQCPPQMWIYVKCIAKDSKTLVETLKKGGFSYTCEKPLTEIPSEAPRATHVNSRETKPSLENEPSEIPHPTTTDLPSSQVK